MFLCMRNEGIEETALANRCLELFAEIFPATWTAHLTRPTPSQRTPDFLVTLQPPSGSPIVFAVEIKGAPLSSESITTIKESLAKVQGIPCVFAEYLSPRARSALVNQGLNGMDSTGWARITNDVPTIHIVRPGSSRAPRQARNESIERLSGPSTGRVLRFLITAPLPMGVREIAQACAVSPGTVSKLLPTLEREGVIAPRSPRGLVTSVHRQGLVERWAQDYSLQQSSRKLNAFIDPRGIAHALKTLAFEENAVLTGVQAGLAYLPATETSVVPNKQLTVLCSDPVGVARRIGLYPVDKSEANVFLALPKDPDLLRHNFFSDRAQGWVAPLGQVLVDLKSLPGREADVADQIIGTLERQETEEAWTRWGQERAGNPS